MLSPRLENIAQALLQRSEPPSSQRLVRRLVPQLLLEGSPVTPARLARAMHASVEAMTAMLQEMPDLEYDEHGNIVGRGVTLLPTAHQLHVTHHPLFTWCAWDTLYFPIRLKVSAQVVSACPVTAETIRFTVTPEQTRDLEPKAAMISLMIRDGTACPSTVRETFCNASHFFASHEAAVRWQHAHPDVLLLEVEEAYQVATCVVQARYPQEEEA
jgi:alkylmercury lyase